jgi:hypothetical protein
MRTLPWLSAAIALAACAGDTPTHGRGEGGEGGDGTSGAGSGMTAAGAGGGATSTAGSGSGGLVMTGSGGSTSGTGGMLGMGGSGMGGELGPGGCGPIDTTSLCADPTMGGSPPPPPGFGGTCPDIKVYTTAGGSAADTVNTIQSASGARTFYVMAPDNACPGEKFPLVFLWHWIGGSGRDWLSFVTQDLVNEYRFIAVMPDGTREPFKWAFTVLDALVVEQDLKLFDDMFACMVQQFDINLGCVASLGVSAGGLFNSQVIQSRGKWLSSAVVISGGTGAVVLPWVGTGSPHKLPVIAFWGGPADNLAGFSFDVLMKDMEAGLQRDGHYFIECVHNCGHAPPLLMPPAGSGSPLAPLFDFLMNHPYGLPTGTSPYKTAGKLPDGFPPWCSDKGMGTAPPANIAMCPAAICASPDTPIATPDGERPIAELREGDLVYSMDKGNIVPVPLAQVGRTAVTNHHVVRVALDNGRMLEVSGHHPLADGGTFADLEPGSLMDGVAVRSVEQIPYDHPFTHDILPASDTGSYFAAGVRIGSTLH